MLRYIKANDKKETPCQPYKDRHIIQVNYIKQQNALKNVLLQVLLLVYKSLSGLGPQYIGDMLTEYNPIRSQKHKRSAQNGESAFSYCAGCRWNQLPEEIRCAKTVATFRSKFKIST